MAAADRRTDPGDRLWEEWDVPPRVPTIPEIHLDGFDGPMDLLLDLAERQQVDLGSMSILDLATQFLSAMEHYAMLVPIERRADWLIIATRIVHLRSRLLHPQTREEAAAAKTAASMETRRLAALIELRSATRWLGDRPQLGIDAFARGLAADLPGQRTSSYVGLMEACLVVVRGRAGQPGVEALETVYTPQPPVLWRLAEAIARIIAILADVAAGDLADFAPPVADAGPDRPLRARAALASTFLAGLELAKQGAVDLHQEEDFGTIRFSRRQDHTVGTAA